MQCIGMKAEKKREADLKEKKREVVGFSDEV
jgi:hypothetical protein